MKSNLLGISALALMGALVLGETASSAPVQFGSNYFEYISADSISWDDANAASAASSFMGLTGHLAIVTSAAENAFLFSLVTPFTTYEGAWLGGTCTPTMACSWINGQQFSQGQTPVSGAYVNFGGLEPNSPGLPSWVYMNIGTDHVLLFPDNPIAPGQWADAGTNFSTPCCDPIKGYFVEYSATPLPAALPLFGTGLGALGLLAWRRKRKNAAVN